MTTADTLRRRSNNLLRAWRYAQAGGDRCAIERARQRLVQADLVATHAELEYAA